MATIMYDNIPYSGSGGGGGGTNVIANPQGTATDDLEKIQIGDTIFDIPGSGGGGGGGGSSVTALYTGHVTSTSTTPIELSDSIDNYDFVLVGGYNYNSGNNREQFNSVLIHKNDYYRHTEVDDVYWTHLLSGSSSRRIGFYFPDSTHIILNKRDTASLDVIYGIKLGSGGGSSGVNYSTTEQDTGLKWIDGSPIYQITEELTSEITLNNTAYTSFTPSWIGSVDQFVNCTGYRLSSSQYGAACNSLLACKSGNNQLSLFSSPGFGGIKCITFQYTKVST